MKKPSLQRQFHVYAGDVLKATYHTFERAQRAAKSASGRHDAPYKVMRVSPSGSSVEVATFTGKPPAKHKRAVLRLVHSIPNAAFMFIFGDSPLRMDGEALFYQTKAEAVAAAKRHGLGVKPSGLVHSVGENPFGKDTFNAATRMGAHERGSNPRTSKKSKAKFGSGDLVASLRVTKTPDLVAVASGSIAKIIRRDAGTGRYFVMWMKNEKTGWYHEDLFETMDGSKHERGENPRVSRELKTRIDRVLGKKGRG